MRPLSKSPDFLSTNVSSFYVFLILKVLLCAQDREFLFKMKAQQVSDWTWSEGSSHSDKSFTCFLAMKRMERDSPTPGIQTLCLATMGRVRGSQGWKYQVSDIFTTQYQAPRPGTKLTSNVILNGNIKSWKLYCYWLKFCWVFVCGRKWAH